MPTVADILQSRTTLELRHIASRLGVRTRSTTAKPDLAGAIATFWLHNPARYAVLNSLSPQARSALQSLAALRSVPRSVFLAEFGAIRSTRTNDGTQDLPWRTPQSAAEELAYTGLLQGGDNRPLTRTETYFLPPDLEPLVKGFLASQPVAVDEEPFLALTAATPFCLLHDSAELLAWLQRCRHLDLPLHRGRWLPADMVRGLNRCLVYPEPQPLPRSHKRTRRLRYLMFWLTATQLQQDGAITPHGWRWLDLPPLEQIRALWQGWQSAHDELRAAYDWPDGHLPAPWPQLLLGVLPTLPETWTAADAAAALLAASPLPGAYWTANLDHDHSLQQLTEAICGGPLAHFGIVTWSTTPGRAGYTLTPLGRHLLRGEPPPPDTELTAQPAMASWNSEGNDLLVERPATLITRGLPVLTAAAERIESRQHQGSFTHRYHLTAASLRRSALHGLRLALLLESLEAIGIVLPSAETALLHDMCSVPPVFEVDLVTLLRAPDSPALAAAQANSAIAGHLAKLLNPTAAVVDMTPADVRTLLHKQGFAANEPGDTGKASGPVGEFAATWLAGQLYQHLQQFLPLALPPPYAAMEAAFAELVPAQQAALAAIRDKMVEDLLNLLDGRAFTPPPHPSDPAEWRPVLEQAMVNQAWLEMLYFSPARNLITRRHIQPAWFIQQPGPAYVVAYCQEAGAMLTFRLDRIQALEPQAQPD